MDGVAYQWQCSMLSSLLTASYSPTICDTGQLSLRDECLSIQFCSRVQTPSYFALILRAFSVIEGIALRVDSEYSIVRMRVRGCECMTAERVSI